MGSSKYRTRTNEKTNFSARLIWLYQWVEADNSGPKKMQNAKKTYLPKRSFRKFFSDAKENLLIHFPKKILIDEYHASASYQNSLDKAWHIKEKKVFHEQKCASVIRKWTKVNYDWLEQPIRQTLIHLTLKRRYKASQNIYSSNLSLM